MREEAHGVRVVEGGEKAGVPAAGVKRRPSALPSEGMQRRFLNVPSVRGEACSGNGSSDKPEAVMKQGEYS